MGLSRDFPKSNLWLNIGPSQLKNEQKLPKMEYIIPNIGENFMKIQTKLCKVTDR